MLGRVDLSHPLLNESLSYDISALTALPVSQLGSTMRVEAAWTIDVESASTNYVLIAQQPNFKAINDGGANTSRL